VKHLDGLSDEEVVELNIPTGVPLLYELDERMAKVSSRYLGDPSEVAARAEAVARQGELATPIG
jgi:2,3-bisphosphoglycerate-dependent phosphoglycerate mutase